MADNTSADNTTLTGGESGQKTAASMDPALTTIQPGGGIVMSIELAWGRLRRAYLNRFRRGFVERMEITRQGTRGTIPFVPVDPRDIKYYRNQDTHWWAEADDPYRWRDSLPFVRAGLAELVVIGGGFLCLALLAGSFWWPLAVPLLVLFGLVVWFFRDPTREIPSDIGTIVSPADGKLVQIDRIDDPDLGSCVQFGIFLSIFNVHANRASLPGRVVAVRYKPGKFLNALRPESAQQNENLDVILSDTEFPERMFRIRQITGQFARRIVCWVRPGDVLARGEMFGMIKLGSRTELIIPESESLEIVAEIGDKICAGSTILGRYRHRLGNQTSDARPDENPSDKSATP
jgi:phosphatidylserine decarboxylase